VHANGLIMVIEIANKKRGLQLSRKIFPTPEFTFPTGNFLSGRSVII